MAHIRNIGGYLQSKPPAQMFNLQDKTRAPNALSATLF
jgi:hypothetical protein